MADKDKINVGFSLASLEKEIDKGAQAEPLKVALSGNKIITFKNPADLPFFLLASLDDADSEAGIVDLFKALLAEEDYEALVAENPSGALIGKLFERVSEHYQEATASAQKS